MVPRRARRRQGGSPYRGRQGGGMKTPNPNFGRARGGRKVRRRIDPPVATRPMMPSKPTPGVVGPTAAPVHPTSATARANAQQMLTQGNVANRDAIFRAAMGLGDPTVFAKLKADPNFRGYRFAQDPNSAFASLARQEQEGLEDIDVGRNANNTFFSGFRLDDRADLSGEINRQRLRASTSYLDQLREYAAALAGTQGDYRQMMTDADQMDIDYALAQEPEDRTAPKPKPKPEPKRNAKRGKKRGRKRNKGKK